MNPTVNSLRSARRVIVGVETPAVPDTYTSHKETAIIQPIGEHRPETSADCIQLVKDLNEAVVKADVAVLDQVLHEDYVHHRPRGINLPRDS